MNKQTFVYTLVLAMALYALPSHGEVLLWNTLGSDSEISSSAIGPGGEKNFGAFTPGPFPNFGQAFVNNNANPYANAVTFPASSVVSKSKGTVAFWAKFNNFPSALFDAVTPLSGVQNDPQPNLGWRIGFGSNNGCGGSGFYGTFGVGVDGYCTALVDTATQSGTLDSILGDRSAWHHYAMVWNEAGISQLGGRKVYLYIDGELKTTPRYWDGSPWGSIPTDSRFALAYFYNINGASIAVDNLVVWDDVKTDFSDRFNENPVGQTFSAFVPRAIFKMGAKAHDDTFHISAKFGLGAESDGIDPLSEPVGINFGSFAATIPAGSFERKGPLYSFTGTINKTDLDVLIHVPQTNSRNGIAPAWFTPADHWFKVKATHANLGGTVLPPKLQFTVGDDLGTAKLNVGQARFGKGKDGEEWVKGGD